MKRAHLSFYLSFWLPSTLNLLAFTDSVISSINLSLSFLLLTTFPSERIVKVCLEIVVTGYVFVAMQRVQRKMKMRILGTCSRRNSKIC